MWIIEQIARFFARPQPPRKPSLRLTDDGLQILEGETVVADVHWREVTKIIAYKHDIFAYDEICVALLMSDDWWVEISEQFDGFCGIFRVLEERFAVPDKWYSKVMIPPFERNEMVLWEKGNEPLS